MLNPVFGQGVPNSGIGVPNAAPSSSSPLFGNGAVGDVVCVGPGTTQVEDCTSGSIARLGGPTTPVVLKTTELWGINNVLNGSSFNVGTQGGMSQFMTWTGTMTGSPFVQQNNLSGTSQVAGQGAYSILSLGATAGAGMTGNIYTLDSLAQVVGAVTGSDVELHGARFISTTALGMNGVMGAPAGIIIGAKSNSLITSSNGYIAAGLAHEIVASNFDATTQDNIGISIASGSTQPGTRNDDGIAFNATYGGTGTYANFLIDVAPTGLGFALASTGTLIGSRTSYSTTNGVDLTNGTFSGSAFKSNGWSVNGSGNLVWSGNFSLFSGATLVEDYGVTTPSRISLFGGVISFTQSGAITSGNLIPSGTSQLNWSTRGIMTSPAVGSIQLGAADAAAPVAEILRAQSVVAGTSNIAGQNWLIVGSLSTGSGTSGDIVMQTGGTGAGATVQNTAATALTLKGGTQAVLTTGTLTVGTLASATGLFVCETAGLLSSGVTTCVASDRSVKHDIEPINDELITKVIDKRGVRFTYNDGAGAPGRRIGVIANDWEVDFPELVDVDSAGIRHFDYAATWGLTVEMFRRMQGEIDVLRASRDTSK